MAVGANSSALGRLSYEIREQNEKEVGDVSKYCRDFCANIFSTLAGGIKKVLAQRVDKAKRSRTN